jgi:hypothetical protein
MTGGSAFDFATSNRSDQQQQQQQQLPSFGGSRGMNGMNPIGPSYTGSSSSQSSSRQMSNNGFDSRPTVSNGFGGGGGNSSANGFERSISGNMFDSVIHGGSSSNGFSRQMSMPSNLCDHGNVSNGFGNGRNNGSGGDNNFR